MTKKRAIFPLIGGTLIIIFVVVISILISQNNIASINNTDQSIGSSKSICMNSAITSATPTQYCGLNSTDIQRIVSGNYDIGTIGAKRVNNTSSGIDTTPSETSTPSSGASTAPGGGGGAAPAPAAAVCGNGATESGEVCDDGSNNGSYGYCNSSCSALGPRCGDDTCQSSSGENSTNCADDCPICTAGQTQQCGDTDIGVCAYGTQTCADNGTWGNCGGNLVTASAELCDGLDNDCDGEDDDGTGESWYNEATTCGVGACASTGVWTCTSATKTDTCSAGSPTTEVCGDSIDQDCNGSDLVCEVCGDSIIQTPNDDGQTEACDDGNTANGDGCSSVCAVEAGYSCVGEPSVCSLTVAGTFYYVDKNATGNNDGTSWTNAYTVIQVAFDNNDLEPGDTVLVAGGTYYPDDISKGIAPTRGIMPYTNDSGDATAQVTIKVKTGETVIIDGQDINEDAFYLDYVNYFTIDGFSIVNHDSYSIRSHHSSVSPQYGIIVRNCNITTSLHPLGAFNNRAGLAIDNSHNLLVENNFVTSETGSVYIQTDGMQFAYSDSIIIRNNTVMMRNAYNSDINPHNDGIQGWACNNIKVYNNYINMSTKAGQQQGIYLEGVTIGNDLGTWEVYNNVVIGIWGSTGISLHEKQDISEQHVYNNMVIQTYDGLSGPPLWGLPFSIDGDNIYFKNNIALSARSSPVVGLPSDIQIPARIDYNLYSNAGGNIASIGGKWYDSLPGLQADGYGIHSIISDPLLDSEYLLTGSSPAIDNGVDLSSEIGSLDIEGITRPQGVAWDIGAYEFTD